MKYICGNGHVFDDPICWTEHQSNEGPGEEMCGCPECYDGFDEAFDCDFCRTTKPVSEKSEVFVDCCTSCEKNLLKEISVD